MDWSSFEVSTIGDDNSGSSVALADVNGIPALTITPGGSSDETKIAIPFTGADLAAWAGFESIELPVYLPAENSLNANMFFLGMADVTGNGFEWIAGVFGDAAEADNGWRLVTYPIDHGMQRLTADHNYMVYLSFFHQDGGKPPLTEPFSIGTMSLTDPQPIVTQEAVATGTTAASTIPASVHTPEIDALLSQDDAQFLDSVAQATFGFFWNEANPDNGLIRDRSTADSPASIASVGFGLAAIPIGIDRGWITYDEGYQRALTTLQTFVNGGVQGEHGFFYHWIDMRTGERAWNSEVSSIDTALLVAGAIVAGQYFSDTDVQTLADELYANVEWDWMAANRDLVRMGWTPEDGLFGASWDHFDESMILYALAIGSPTHPVSASAWDQWRRPVDPPGGYIYLPGETLFVYQYPQAFLNLHAQEDHYANYWNNTTLACQRNRAFAIDESHYFLTYRDGVWGISASDGPDGYHAYGAAPVNQDGTIAPYASIACLPFTPAESLESMRAMLSKYGSWVWREYGYVSAINENEDWYSRDFIGIDEGDALLMITNYQDAFVWNLFMANEHIQQALDAMGFVPSSGDYAVTPGYMHEVTNR